jgi:hypothetical protein
MADRQQQQIIRTIISVGKRRGMPREAILSALATGSVESRFRNPDSAHSDRDSAGWRQERSMYYKNPRNVKAAANRYYDEWNADAKGRGLSIGQQAQAVQQSGFPDRYQGRVPTAKRLLRRYGGGDTTSSNTSSITTRIPGVDNSDLRQSLKLGYLANRHDPNALLDLAQGLQGAADVPGSVTSQTRTLHKNVKGLVAGNGVPINDMLRRAVKWDKAKAPYLWGGGHGSIAKPGQPVDCSGYVSAVLGLKTPLVSGDLAKWGNPGRGRHVTVWANDGHVLMQIGNKWFGTSASNPGGGAGRISPPSRDYLSRFTPRHP